MGSESSQSAECKQLKVHAMREAAIDCLVRPSGAINEAGELDVDKYYAAISTAFQQIDLNDASKQNILDSARACFQSPVPSPYTMFHYRPENIQPHMRNLVSGTQYHLNMGELRPSSAMVASDCLTTLYPTVIVFHHPSIWRECTRDGATEHNKKTATDTSTSVIL